MRGRARVRSTSAALGVGIALAAAVTASAQSPVRVVPLNRDEVTLSYAPLVDKAAPAVVNVHTRKIVTQRAVSPLLDEPIIKRFFGGGGALGGRERAELSLGSGVIVDPNGIVVTNHHVIEGAKRVLVVLADKRQYVADVVLADARTDLAILKLGETDAELPYLEFGDLREVRIGDLVLAIGNPFGVGQTVTEGIVSALARTAVGIADYRSFIQTDASINPGNSGGALIDIHGRLIGINTAIFSRGGGGGSIGIGFAVPSSMVRRVVTAAIAGRPLVRPWLGIYGIEVNPQIAGMLGLPRPVGVVIDHLHPDGPLAQAGLAPGDVILALNGREVKDMTSLRFSAATHEIGETVALTIYRRGRIGRIAVEMMAPPEQPPRTPKLLRGYHHFGGATVAGLSPALAEDMNLDSAIAGVVVLGVRPASRAASNGLRRGDIVLAINGKAVAEVKDLDRFIRKPFPGWKVLVRRDDRDLEVELKAVQIAPASFVAAPR